VAAEVGEFIAVMREVFPEVVVGDTEPLAGASSPASYTGWLETFRRVNGYDLAFLHMDIDWGRPTWADEVKTIEDFGRRFGVPVGIIYTGNLQDASDEAWLSIAGERVRLHTFSGPTSDSDVLVFAPFEPVRGKRLLRIETTLSPSWVAWREIEVIAAQ